jgi:hypothetical protein
MRLSRTCHYRQRFRAMKSRGETLGFRAGIVLGEISIDGRLQLGVVPLYHAVLAAVQRPARFGEVTLSERGSRCRPQAAWLSSRNRASSGLAMTLDPPAPRSVQFG